MKEKTKFENLSIPLKIAIITSYVIGTLYLILVIVGFIKGLLQV